MAMPDMRKKPQVTARMTDQFGEDLNLIMSYFGITKVTDILHGSVAAQADAIRKRQAGDRRALAPALRDEGEVLHQPGMAIACPRCSSKGLTSCEREK